MTGDLAGTSTQRAHDRPSLPDPVGHADHGQNAVWMGWFQPGLPEFAAAVPAQPETGPCFGEGLATRQAGDVLLGGASGAGSHLLNTKASQEAACSRAPAAIVPGQKPESRDTGVSRFSENGSYPAATDAAEGRAGHVDDPGSSGNAENGSHLAGADVAEGHAGQVGDPGCSRFAGKGSHLAVVRRNAPLPGQKPDAQTRQCSSTSARTGALFDKSPMLPPPTRTHTCLLDQWQISV